MESSAYERDSFGDMWSKAQFTVFVNGQAIVCIGWRKPAESFPPGPAIARDGPPVSQPDSLRYVTGTTTETTGYEDRLTDFKRQARCFGNSGHGSENLASVLLVLNLLAFAMHTACDLAERAWQAAGSGDWMFRQLQALTARVVFDTWRQLLNVVADKIEIPP